MAHIIDAFLHIVFYSKVNLLNLHYSEYKGRILAQCFRLLDVRNGSAPEHALEYPILGCHLNFPFVSAQIRRLSNLKKQLTGMRIGRIILHFFDTK